MAERKGIDLGNATRLLMSGRWKKARRIGWIDTYIEIRNFNVKEDSTEWKTPCLYIVKNNSDTDSTVLWFPSQEEMIAEDWIGEQ